MKINLLFIKSFLIFVILLSSVAHGSFDIANSKGTIGDISNHFLPPTSVTIDIMNNDFLGGTDKYMTGATKLALLKTNEQGFLGTHASYETALNWRGLTPAESECVGGRALPYRVGRYADWLELRSSYSEMVGPYKIQGTLGLGSIRNRGLKLVHRGIHRGIGMTVSGTDYTNQPVGITKAATLSLGRVFGTLTDGLMITGGYGFDPVMRESYLQINYLRPISTHVIFSAEASLARQLASDIYTKINSYRYSASMALFIKNFYQPSVSYTSAFLNPDLHGQVYVEPLRFVIAL